MVFFLPGILNEVKKYTVPHYIGLPLITPIILNCKFLKIILRMVLRLSASLEGIAYPLRLDLSIMSPLMNVIHDYEPALTPHPFIPHPFPPSP